LPKPYSKNKLDIKTLKHLSKRLGFTISVLQEIASCSKFLYKFDKEPKKNGGFREISKPHFRLKRVQSAIHKLLQEIRVSNSAHGGIKCRSNLTNAKVHCNQSLLLNLDLRNYFPSISHYRVFELFHKKLGCSESVASLLTKLTTVKGQVPQGSPMSTDLANLVFREIDLRLEGLTKQFGLNFTRYIDDLSFSGKDIPQKFIRLANQIIDQSGFVLNPEKEILSDHSMPKIVTGLSVNRKRPNVPRNVRREVRRQAYLFQKHDAPKLTEYDAYIRDQQISGKMSYINYINKKS
jgi:RNA-directed DNA polymerase